MDCSPSMLLCPWTPPGKRTGMSDHSLLQGIFLIQESNLGLLHWRRILYHLSQEGSPRVSNHPVFLVSVSNTRLIINVTLNSVPNVSVLFNIFRCSMYYISSIFFLMCSSLDWLAVFHAWWLGGLAWVLLHCPTTCWIPCFLCLFIFWFISVCWWNTKSNSVLR